MIESDILSDFSEQNFKHKRRRDLLPVWIKIFIWIFIIIGGFCIPVFVLGAFGFSFQIALYGYETKDPFSLIGIILTSIYLLKGVVALSLWLEKDYAIVLGLVDAIIGILLCIFSMFGILYFSGISKEFKFRPEILILLIYFAKLLALKKIW